MSEYTQSDDDLICNAAGAAQVIELYEDKVTYGAIQANCLQPLRDRIATLEELIENANQASSETQPSWKHRCYAIMSALGQDYGDPDWVMPDDAKKIDILKEQLAEAQTKADILESQKAILLDVETKLTQERDTLKARLSNAYKVYPNLDIDIIDYKRHKEVGDE